ncbi:MAG: M3 family oligoendopeptidase [Chitinophagaceae bacterium]|nr:M3 family oligoendopeptidase [Chitinophagaceae bacterium]
MTNYSADILPLPRHFLPKDLKVTDWQSIEPYFDDLLSRPIESKEALEQWLKDMSELEAVISEDVCRRQINMTCDTTNKEFEEAFNYFVLEIQPKIQPYAFKLNQKLVGSTYTQQLDKKKFFTYLRSVRSSIELYREENIPIKADLGVLQQKYAAITGAMTVNVNGQEYTLQQASKFFESTDRTLREEVYRKINERRLQDKDALNGLFNQLVEKRDQEAKNVGFENYRDYKFKELNRFDYTKEDCFSFHESVKKYVLPLANELLLKKREKLQLDTLRPWDTEAEPEGIKPLAPFKTGDELVEKAIECFTLVKPFFGDCLRTMRKMGNLDLESRQGKAPGGYNMPLAETGAPFIFMNAAGQMHDVTTMVHEGGHAVQSFLTHGLELSAFKEYPMEIAEVASMAMELFSMDYWHVFFDNVEELKRAKIHQLERVITLFPWIALIDKFQHWIYANPKHTSEEREAEWVQLFKDFTADAIDYSGLEKYVANGWQKQLHLFEVPFYYIEYGIAQLGAVGLWKQYKTDKEKALDNYISALSLGGTRTLPELYNAAGLKFDFSGAYIKELMDFVHEELKKIEG